MSGERTAGGSLLRYRFDPNRSRLDTNSNTVKRRGHRPAGVARCGGLLFQLCVVDPGGALWDGSTATSSSNYFAVTPRRIARDPSGINLYPRAGPCVAVSRVPCGRIVGL